VRKRPLSALEACRLQRRRNYRGRIRDWYSFDARHNRRRIGRIVIVRGRDASDVPMLHTFGSHILKTFRVITEEIKELARLPAA
jgi:transglutaminase-like putative cysteine protease